ncbi:MAG TPA: hypothetical protein IAB03_08660 [Candidatus Gallibacteroides avistercoris]|uniref:Uncharacterized protein n=1 Tax=Candidatus Gallibacteroides avistercoris TaxID=2840833 RepID=A0A9D1M8L4_9BACT|nr:hypothetical protein [Candidatus Gallibacteroides avistercoris]
MNKDAKLWIGIVAGLVFVLVLTIGYMVYQHSKMQNLVEEFDIQKEELEDEYAQLAIQYEGFKLDINNDSIQMQYENERMKVQRLQEELKTVKSTNAKRIRELQKELNTLRAVMRGLVATVDSLNQLNQKLEQENKVVTQKYQEATRTVSKIKKDNEALSAQVTLAAQLSAVGITAEALNKRGKETDKISKATQLKFSFTISRNVTAEIGEKYVYLRIMKPDDDVLVKDRANVFVYEDQEIAYSTRKLIEYGGEDLAVVMYWPITEYLTPGSYRVDIFVDGNLIGKKSFTLEK